MAFATTADGAHLHYRDFDFTPPWRSAPVVVLAHGLRSNQLAWNPWIPLLGHDFRVITFDARGRGESSVPPVGFRFSMEQYAADVAAVLDAAGVERAHYVGTAFGGVVGQQFAAQFPARVGGLVLMSTPYRFTPLAGVIDGWIRSVETEGLEAFTRRDIPKLFPPDADSREVDWHVRGMVALGPRFSIDLFRFLKTVDMATVLPRIQTPTLVMAATASDRAPTADLEYLAGRIPNARLVKFEGYHHNIAHLVPERCARLTIEFLREIDTPG